MSDLRSAASPVARSAAMSIVWIETWVQGSAIRQQKRASCAIGEARLIDEVQAGYRHRFTPRADDEGALPRGQWRCAGLLDDCGGANPQLVS